MCVNPLGNQKLEFGNKAQIEILRKAGFYDPPVIDEDGRELHRFEVKRTYSVTDKSVVFAATKEEATERAQNEDFDRDGEVGWFAYDSDVNCAEYDANMCCGNN